MSAPGRLRVELGTRGYDILVGEGLLGAAGQHCLPLLRQKRVCVVTDETVAALHLEELGRSLTNAGISYQDFIVPPGEQTKDFAHLAELCGRLLDAKVARDTTLIAFGGGVVGDLTGFAASILLRGVDFIQIPTTLLAQVDSSVGGKTGIDMPQGKNLVGSFHQPRLVLADTAVLSTLPERELRAGYAEVAKYGLINDAEFFTWLETHGNAVIEGDAAARRQAVLTSCGAKAAIVAADERESLDAPPPTGGGAQGGGRALLNLGHTFAHALEAETGYSDELLHGEAVAMGMVMAFELSAQLGLCPAEDAARVHRHLAAIGLPTGLESLPGHFWTTEALLEHMSRDKKVRDGRITFVLVRGIGQAVLSREVEPAAVAALLNDAIAA
jgi:3-dehydroquinate synthase